LFVEAVIEIKKLFQQLNRSKNDTGRGYSLKDSLDEQQYFDGFYIIIMRERIFKARAQTLEVFSFVSFLLASHCKRQKGWESFEHT
jgi:hypothetical protein